MKVFDTSWKGWFVEMTWGCLFGKRGLQFGHQPLTETRHQKFYVRLKSPNIFVGFVLFPILRMFLFNFKESSFEHLGFFWDFKTREEIVLLQMIHSNIGGWNCTFSVFPKWKSQWITVVYFFQWQFIEVLEIWFIQTTWRSCAKWDCFPRRVGIPNLPNGFLYVFFEASARKPYRCL